MLNGAAGDKEEAEQAGQGWAQLGDLLLSPAFPACCHLCFSFQELSSGLKVMSELITRADDVSPCPQGEGGTTMVGKDLALARPGLEKPSMDSSVWMSRSRRGNTSTRMKTPDLVTLLFSVSLFQALGVHNVDPTTFALKPRVTLGGKRTQAFRIVGFSS